MVFRKVTNLLGIHINNSVLLQVSMSPLNSKPASTLHKNKNIISFRIIFRALLIEVISDIKPEQQLGFLRLHLISSLELTDKTVCFFRIRFTKISINHQVQRRDITYNFQQHLFEKILMLIVIGNVSSQFHLNYEGSN